MVIIYFCIAAWEVVAGLGLWRTAGGGCATLSKTQPGAAVPH